MSLEVENTPENQIIKQRQIKDTIAIIRDNKQAMSMKHMKQVENNGQL